MRAVKSSLDDNYERKEAVKMYNECMMKVQLAAMKAKCKIDEFLYDENGEVNIIAMIIIIAIAVALAIAFRTKIKELFDKIWTNLDQQATGFANAYQ